MKESDVGGHVTRGGRKGNAELDSIEEEVLSVGEQRRQALKPNLTLWLQLKAIFYNWPSVLIPLVPAGFVVNYTHQSPISIFCVNFLAIVPSAVALSFATDEVAIRFGDKVGALLNMAFGYIDTQIQLPAQSIC